jgi:hypothetical protein
MPLSRLQARVRGGPLYREPSTGYFVVLDYEITRAFSGDACRGKVQRIEGSVCFYNCSQMATTKMGEHNEDYGGSQKHQ